jgi:hypothetical protein
LSVPEHGLLWRLREEKSYADVGWNAGLRLSTSPFRDLPNKSTTGSISRPKKDYEQKKTGETPFRRTRQRHFCLYSHVLHEHFAFGGPKPVCSRM